MMAKKRSGQPLLFYGVWVLPTSKNAKMPPAADRAFFGKVYAFPLLATAPHSRFPFYQRELIKIVFIFQKGRVIKDIQLVVCLLFN
jgi:hypothetical protein